MANLMRTSNPALNEKAFQGRAALGEAMTLQGTVNKTGVLLLCVVVAAAWTWGLSHSETPQAAIPWMIGGIFGGFVVALVTVFKKEWSPVTSLIYSLLQGLALGVIRATEKFKIGVFAATGGIMLLYLVDIVLRFFSRPVSFIHEGTPIGIAFSLFVVIIAALNLVLDFDLIETGVSNGAPKYMEWYGAFGLMVTLIWLYLEILRLLGKARRR